MSSLSITILNAIINATAHSTLTILTVFFGCIYNFGIRLATLADLLYLMHSGDEQI